MKILLRLLLRALHHKWWLTAAYIATAGAATSYLYLPKLFGNAIDMVQELLAGGEFSNRTILVAALTILVVSALRGVFSFGQSYFGEGLSQATVYTLRNDFYDHVQHMSFAYHDKNHTGNLISRAITDVEVVNAFVRVGLVQVPYFLALFLVTTYLLIKLDWQLGLLAISFTPVVAFVSTYVRLNLRRIWLIVQEDMGKLSTVLQENLSGARVVRAFAAEKFEENKYESKSRDVQLNIVRTARLQAINGTLLLVSFSLIMGLILWYGGYRVVNGYLTAGELAQFLFYMQVLMAPVRSVGPIVNNFARTLSAGERLYEVLDAKSPVQESPEARELPRVKGHVRFEDVHFSYNGTEPVLNGVNIEAAPGQIIALVGPLGSGKTSIVNLLPRFYDVTSGRITIDGIDIRDVKLKSLRQNIGIVQQDVFLFTASISENIAYGRSEAAIDEIIQAARIAQLDNQIREFADGYATEVGERGATLSGGQKQRLSIARAVLLDPPILILDDSTSSVDAHTEEQIRKAMEMVMQGRTTFVVAHRLSTIHRADQILVLEKGVVVERGTHKELLKKGGLYREIYELQLRPHEEVLLEHNLHAETIKESC